jgi:hypothetical protein
MLGISFDTATLGVAALMTASPSLLDLEQRVARFFARLRAA